MVPPFKRRTFASKKRYLMRRSFRDMSKDQVVPFGIFLTKLAFGHKYSSVRCFMNEGRFGCTEDDRNFFYGAWLVLGSQGRIVILN
jgi:hypothetical protein